MNDIPLNLSKHFSKLILKNCGRLKLTEKAEKSGGTKEEGTG